MNILFRKNISEGGGGAKSSGPGRSSGGRAARSKGKQAKQRQVVSGGFGDDGFGLRTHIFLTPPLQTEPGGWRERGGHGGFYSDGISTGLVDDSLQYQVQWRKSSGPRASDFGPAEVSFTDVGGYTTSKTRKPISLLPVPKAELSQLRTLDKDCFIIPVASLDRFLPAGVPMPLVDKRTEEDRNLSVLEVEDPKICILIHLMTAMEPIEPILESPLSLPHQKQKRAAAELLAEVGQTKTAVEGMLLSNIEKNAEFPFISYYVVNKATTDPREFFHNCRGASLRKFDPKTMRYSAAHTFDLFNEVATIARPPLDPLSKRPISPSTGFIVSLYKVFEGDDGEKFEKNWLYWTGARMIYRALPKSVGLRRITLHKSVSSGDKLYLLLVECSNFLEELGAAAALIPALRARLCGYTGLYRMTAAF